MEIIVELREVNKKLNLIYNHQLIKINVNFVKDYFKKLNRAFLLNQELKEIE